MTNPFEDDLCKIKQTQDHETWLREKRAQDEWAEKKRMGTELIDEAQILSSEKIEPLLKTVNRVYANGKGIISRPGYNEFYEVRFETTLIWNDTSKRGY